MNIKPPHTFPSSCLFILNNIKYLIIGVVGSGVGSIFLGFLFHRLFLNSVFKKFGEFVNLNRNLYYGSIGAGSNKFIINF